jgi:MoaA/NifB/PqqE/SkfB family radical SAM enzyme
MINLSVKDFSRHFITSKFERHTNRSKGPLFINWAVTYRCNSRCMMCDIWKLYRNHPEKMKKELSVDDYREIFALNRKYLKNLIHIGITGGEPFLRDDLTEIISIIHNKCPKTTIDITTNGLNPEKIETDVKEILRKCPDLRLNINISIEGPEKTHNRIRGHDNFYEMVMRTAKKLIDVKKNNNIDVKVSFTILPQNCNEIYKVYKISQKLGFKFSCRPVHTSTSFYGNNERLKRPFTPSTIKKIEKQLNKIPNKDFFLEHTPAYLTSGNLIVPCYSGFYSIYIDPYGDVYPCLFIDKKLGSVKDHNFFKKTWVSKEFNDIRNDIKKKRCPKCWTECETNHSLYLDGVNYITWVMRRPSRILSVSRT